MNELLIALLILFIACFMFGIIILIMSADRKINDINKQIEIIKTTDFSKIKKVVSVLKKINSSIKLDKLKHIVEITLTTISAINFVLLIKKLLKKYN